MLSIKIPTVSYESNNLLKNVNIEAFRGNITVLVGASGSGKSTIINSLTFKNNFASEYILDQVDLLKLDESGKQCLKQDKMSIVYQNPSFVENLTVEENILLVKALSKNCSEYYNWLDKLNIGELLSKFPNELSGGEQVRLSLLLAIIKDGDLIILDEPTSSLDEHYTNIVIEILKELKNNNRIIFISTHDFKIVQESDIVYHINDKNVILEKKQDCGKDDIVFKPLSGNIIDIKKVVRILSGTKKHDKIYKKIVLFITVLLISFSGFISNFNNVVKLDNQNILNQVSSRELLIYKPSGGYETQGISNSADGNDVISESDLNKVKNVKNINEIRPRVDLSLSNPFILMVEDRDPKKREKNYNIKINFKDGDSVEKNMDTTDAPTLNTYFKDVDYRDEVLKKFNTDINGVYVSRRLAEFLCEDISSLEDATLTLNMYIPVYNSIGKAWSTDENGTTYWPNLVSCKIKKITVPICGILKSSNMGIKNTTNFAIYVRDDYMEDLIDKYKVKETRFCYLLESKNYEYSINEKPENKTILREIKEEPWTPKSYSVFVNDITTLDQVVKDISKLGFNVSNEYFEISAINNSLESVQETIKISSYSMTFVVLVIYGVIKFNNKINEKKLVQFLYDFGLNKCEIHQINKVRYLNNTFKICILSLVLMTLILLIFNYFHYGYTSFGISMFVIIGLLSIIIEYLIPNIIERKILNDKVK